MHAKPATTNITLTWEMTKWERGNGARIQMFHKENDMRQYTYEVDTAVDGDDGSDCCDGDS